MADLILNLTGTHYYNTKYSSKTGSATANDSTQSVAKYNAKVRAQSAADSALSTLHGSPGNGGSTDSTLRIGSSTNTNTIIGEPTVEPYESSGHIRYKASCSWKSERTNRMDSVKLSFINSSISSNIVENAKLKFNFTSTTSAATYYIFAPSGESEQVDYRKYSENTLINKESKISFEAQTQPSPMLIEVDITNIFKSCLDLENNWILISMSNDYYEYNRYIIITDPTIEITYSYTKLSTPTNIQVNKTIAKPNNDSINISWSPVTSELNNNLTSYKIYYSYSPNIVDPTISSSVIDINSTNTSYTFSINDATRANYYTFKVQAVGSIEGGGGDSDLSSSISCRINSLPSVPVVTLATSRIKAGESTVTCTCAPGEDIDTSQTKTVWYNTVNTVSGSQSITSTQLGEGIYYFWTYDGLEYSSSYVTKTIIENTPPTVTIGPISASNNPYISITGSSASSTAESYQWYISSDGNEWLEMTGINSLEFLDYDVTKKINTWNTSFGFKIRVYDDIGDYGEDQTDFTNKTPAIPTYTMYNQTGSNSNVSGTNPLHFKNGIRIKFNEGNLNSNIEYAVFVDGGQYAYSSIVETRDFPLTKSAGTQVSGYISYRCSNLIGQSQPFTIFRALDNTPKNITWALNNTNVYEASLSTLTFSQQLNAFNSNNDMPSDPKSKYSLKLLKGEQYILLNGSDVTSSISVSGSMVVTWIISLSNITKSQWKTLFGTNKLPIGNYDLTIQVRMENNFEDVFTGTQNISLSFEEKALNSSCTLKIKMTDDSFSTIPFNNERYPLFENQTLQFFIAGFQCYTDNYVNISITDGKGKLINREIIPSSENNYIINDQTINFGPLTSIITTENVNFTITISSGTIKENNAYVTGPGARTQVITKSNCKYIRTQLSLIDLNITNIEKSNDTYTVSYIVSDLGGSGEAPCISSYSSKQIEIQCCITANGNYTTIDSAQNLGNGTNGTVSVTQSGLPTNFYVGYRIIVVNAFSEIDQKMPSGSRTHIEGRKNVNIFYGDTPTILYGRNFLGINADTPKNEGSSGYEGILTIRPYENHNIIYIGYTSQEGKIILTQNGTQLDNFIFDSGTWDT